MHIMSIQTDYDPGVLTDAGIDALEEWRDIPGHPAHEASDRGRVRNRISGDILIGCEHNKGYRIVSLKTAPGAAHPKRTITVARAVCLAFYGPPPSDEHQAAHIDGDCKNDAAGNLYWATPVENATDKIHHGTKAWGENHPNALLTNAEVEQIREGIALGVRAAELAKIYGVTAKYIGAIARGDSRKDG